MNHYYFSSFNVNITEESRELIYNSITNRQVQNSSLFSNLLDKILDQGLENIEDGTGGKLLQLIVAELIHKGIIVPIEEKPREIEYLNSLVNFIPIKNTFFRCKSLTEGKLSLLDNRNDSRIIFCSIPYDFGAGVPGTRYGPKLLRNASESITFRGANSLLLDLDDKSDSFFGKEIYDVGNIHLPLNLQSHSLLKVQDLARQIYEKGFPFFIGGDHLFSFPIIEGIYSQRKKPFTVVQLDYHLDIQLWGEFKKGRPIALTEASHANFISWLKLKAPELKIIQIGVHNYQNLDGKINCKDAFSYLKNIGTQISNVEILTSRIDEILNKLPVGEDIYLTIDVDVLNRIYIPNTGYPASLGINISDFYNIVTNLCKNNTLIGVDIMEFGSVNNYDQAPMCEIILTLILQVIKNIKVLR